MNKKSTLNEEFFDCTNVKINIGTENQNIVVNLLDARNRKCIFHFEQVKTFCLNYDKDEVDTTEHISSIKFIEEHDMYQKYKIIFLFKTEAIIECKKFWYETDY